jgi:hypothetical protein
LTSRGSARAKAKASCNGCDSLAQSIGGSALSAAGHSPGVPSALAGGSGCFMP